MKKKHLYAVELVLWLILGSVGFYYHFIKPSNKYENSSWNRLPDCTDKTFEKNEPYFEIPETNGVTRASKISHRMCRIRNK